MSVIIGRVNPDLVLPAIPVKPSLLRYNKELTPFQIGRASMAYRAGFNQPMAVFERIFSFHKALGALANDLLIHLPTEVAHEENGLITGLYSLTKHTFINSKGLSQNYTLVDGRKVLNAEPIVSRVSGESLTRNLLNGIPGWTLICPLQYNLVSGTDNRTPVSFLAGNTGVLSLGLNRSANTLTQARTTNNGESISVYSPNGAVTAGQWIIQAGDLDAASGELRTLVNGQVLGTNTLLGTGGLKITSPLTYRVGSGTGASGGSLNCGPLLFGRRLTLEEHAKVNAALKTLYPWLP